MQFHEFSPGDVIEAGPRLVTVEEIIAFAERYDPQPFHVDAAAAARSRWGGLIASGWMTCGIAMEMAARRCLADSGSYGSPGVDELRWEKPVRPGDQLRLRIHILETRVASSGKTGIVRWRWELYNQHAERVLSLVANSFFAIPPA